jgi:hypothetical protein
MAARKGTMVQEVETADTKVKAKAEPKAEAPEPEAVNEEEYDSTKVDPEQELFEGGPNFAQINEWKDQYGDVYVTSVTPTLHIVWRTISRFEYRNLVKDVEKAVSSGAMTQAEANMYNEEFIAETCILFPEYKRQNTAGTLAGVASTIAQQVMDASAFSSLEVRQL